HTISKRDWSSDVCSSDLRNLLGIKCYGIIISILSIILSILVFITHKENAIVQLYLSTLINLFFLLFWSLKVNKKQTKIAAKRYEIGRASCRERVKIEVVV